LHQSGDDLAILGAAGLAASVGHMNKLEKQQSATKNTFCFRLME